MSSNCKHDWEDRTDVLRTVFAASPESATRHYSVCARCMRIRETAQDEAPAQRPLFRLLEAA
jgi:hypothetical protein